MADESVAVSQISIHAPREGGDDPEQKGHHRKIISIHAPREGGDSNFFILALII